LESIIEGFRQKKIEQSNANYVTWYNAQQRRETGSRKYQQEPTPMWVVYRCDPPFQTGGGSHCVATNTIGERNTNGKDR